MKTKLIGYGVLLIAAIIIHDFRLGIGIWITVVAGHLILCVEDK